MKFDLHSPYKPTGDQPKAITSLLDGLNKGYRDQTLLGVTGSGKTFTMANVIQATQRPTLIISHNKTLAAQLASEFHEYFPKNAVGYFVSYYDYYQPEAYVPSKDLYIEKETDINEEIDRLRHAATENLMTRRDVIIVASVSCIYGIGAPTIYKRLALDIRAGMQIKRTALLRQLTNLQYDRNEVDFHRGTYRSKGDVIDIFPPSSPGDGIRIELAGDRIERLVRFDALTGETTEPLQQTWIFPATQYSPAEEHFEQALKDMERDLKIQIANFKKAGKLLEAQRIEQRTSYDIEMIKQTGFTSGIENYSRYFDGRKAGEPPYTLMDYFPEDYLLFVDESHMTLPQIGGMLNGDRARKDVLVNFGFRLPSAKDNRPLSFDEFDSHVRQAIYVSATPDEKELNKSKQVVEQLIRPTGLIDPRIVVQSTKGQIDDLLAEIRARVTNKQRVLVTTLTKRISEDLTDYLKELDVKVAYIHSDVETLERLEILRDLRLGTYDVLVGINLLREGLDLPEVSLVAILDADKEGFLRSTTSLLQTIGRAARHIDGTVIMYADRETRSMKQAIRETNRRRKTQEAYNTSHNITPKSIQKAVRDDRLSGAKRIEEEVSEYHIDLKKIPASEVKQLLADLDDQMEMAAKNLEFEKAAALRDEIDSIKKSKRPTKKRPAASPSA